jgi:hypothetical protein
MTYLCHYYELDNNNEPFRMQQRAKVYQIINNELYKTFVTCSLLCCLSKAKGQLMLSKIHTGVCGGHIGARALATKVFQYGFSWSAVIDDASMLVETCEACQNIYH